MKVLVILALILGAIYFFAGKSKKKQKDYLERCYTFNDVKACCTLALEMAEIRKRYRGSIESLRIMGCDV